MQRHLPEFGYILNISFRVVTVRNIGPSPLQVFGRMIECCEVIGGDENDCGSIRMMGGSVGILQPSRFKNVTFLYPNMYPYNRKGECSVEIWHKDKMNRTDYIVAKIPFNTYVKNGEVSPTMAGFGDLEKLQTPCSSPDLDPLDNCLPVDCHKKYSGNKNFFSTVRKLCVPNPTCYADPDKEVPDVVYVPACNECRDVDNSITEDDLRTLIRPPSTSPEEGCTTTPLGYKEFLNVRCHHGTFDNDSTLCECHAGWTSAPIPEDIYISSTLLLHFCTIRKPPSKVLNFDPIMEAINSILTDNPLFVVIAAGVTSAVIFLFVCCCVSGRDCKDWNSSDEEDIGEEDNEVGIMSEIDDICGDVKFDGMKSLKEYFSQGDCDITETPQNDLPDVNEAFGENSLSSLALEREIKWNALDEQEYEIGEYPMGIPNFKRTTNMECSDSICYKVELESKAKRNVTIKTIRCSDERSVILGKKLQTRKRAYKGLHEPSRSECYIKRRSNPYLKGILKHNIYTFIELVLLQNAPGKWDSAIEKYLLARSSERFISTLKNCVKRNELLLRVVEKSLQHSAGGKTEKTFQSSKKLTGVFLSVCDNVESSEKPKLAQVTVENECLLKKVQVFTTKLGISDPGSEKNIISNIDKNEGNHTTQQFCPIFPMSEDTSKLRFQILHVDLGRNELSQGINMEVDPEQRGCSAFEGSFDRARMIPENSIRILPIPTKSGNTGSPTDSLKPSDIEGSLNDSDKDEVVYLSNKRTMMKDLVQDGESYSVMKHSGAISRYFSPELPHTETHDNYYSIKSTGTNKSLNVNVSQSLYSCNPYIKVCSTNSSMSEDVIGKLFKEPWSDIKNNDLQTNDFQKESENIFPQGVNEYSKLGSDRYFPETNFKVNKEKINVLPAENNFQMPFIERNVDSREFLSRIHLKRDNCTVHIYEFKNVFLLYVHNKQDVVLIERISDNLQIAEEIHPLTLQTNCFGNSNFRDCLMGENVTVKNLFNPILLTSFCETINSTPHPNACYAPCLIDCNSSKLEPLLSLRGLENLQALENVLGHQDIVPEAAQTSSRMDFTQGQKSLIPIMKTSPRSLRKALLHSNSNFNDKSNLSKSNLNALEIIIGSETSQSTSTMPIETIDKDLISKSLPQVSTIQHKGKPPVSKRLEPTDKKELKQKSESTLRLLRRRPDYDKWAEMFKLHNIEVTAKHLELQYKTIRSVEQAIVALYNFYFQKKELRKGNKKQNSKQRKRNVPNMKEELQAIVVFGTTRGEMKRYNQFVKTFVTLYETFNQRNDGDLYELLFGEIRPGNGVLDPRAFPDRGITRISQNLDLHSIRQILGAAFQAHPMPMKNMLIVAGVPRMLDILERYSTLTARVRYHKELKVHKVPKGLLYDYILKTVLKRPLAIKKSTVKEHLPLLRILWKALIFLPTEELDEFTFVRCINFIAEIFDRKLFKSPKECCTKMKTVKDIYSEYKPHFEPTKQKIPFPAVELILKNLSTMKKRDLDMKLIVRRAKKIKEAIATLNDQPKSSKNIHQLRRDFEHAVNRYYEIIDEFNK